MTDMITVSRKEVEALLTQLNITHQDLRALLEKAEVVSGEPICNLWVCPATLYYKVDRGEHHNSELIPVYTTPQPSRIAELESEIARLNAIIEDMKVIDNVFGKGELPYGSCPVCHGAGLSRERRPNGNDECVNGHVYPSREAMKTSNDK